MVAIAELRERLRGHDEDIARHEKHLHKLDETVSELRTAIAKVATKDDVAALRQDVTNTFYQQLRDANSSIPGKIGILITGGSLIIMIISLYLKSHG